ncbi:MAG: hypothetical protein U5M23_09635 [Marinagarivorans sp.]|nr:hypothetical protein [Marinagarivorans sp.]
MKTLALVITCIAAGTLAACDGSSQTSSSAIATQSSAATLSSSLPASSSAPAISSSSLAVSSSMPASSSNTAVSSSSIAASNSSAGEASQPGTPNSVSGFASMNALGVATTTGGKGGEVITVTTAEQLKELADSNTPYILLIQGEIDLAGDGITLRSNKTIIGLAGAKLINGGFESNNFNNIIIRNLYMDGNHQRDDGIKINAGSHHIWVDHCTLEDYDDGLLDITRGSTNLTLSWNIFTNHDKNILIGHSDAETGDAGTLKTSLHHNWFKGTIQRNPRVRYGEVHVYNNFYSNINSNISTDADSGDEGYGVASATTAQVLVEGNYFQDVMHPTRSGVPEKFDANGMVSSWFSPPANIVERNNIFDNSGTPETLGTVFEPSTYYSYTLDDASTIPTLIQNGAGAGILDPQAILEASR